MGVFDRFPYTNHHELNLDWIIEEVAKYDRIIEEVKTTIDELFRMYPELATEVYQTKQLIQNVDAKYSAMLNEVNLNIDKLKNEKADRKWVESKISELFKKWEQNINTLKMDIAVLKNYVDIRHAQQKEYIDKEIILLEKQIEAITLKPVQQVVSPVTKKKGSVQQALDDLYQHLYDVLGLLWALTAEEYDYLFLTAKQYDDMGLTAAQYDYVGKWFLYPKWLWEERCMGLEAEEYDMLELTAEQYDNAKLTAKKYDCRGLWYFGTYPFETVDGVGIKSKLIS